MKITGTIPILPKLQNDCDFPGFTGFVKNIVRRFGAFTSGATTSL